MKVSGLYLRLVGSFVLVLAAALLLMFTLLRTGKLRPPITRHAEERLTAIREIVSSRLDSEERISPLPEKRLNAVLDIFASAFGGTAWLTAPDGSVIARSFEGAPPVIGDDEVEETKMTTSKGDVLHLLSRKDALNLYYGGVHPLQRPGADHPPAARVEAEKNGTLAPQGACPHVVLRGPDSCSRLPKTDASAQPVDRIGQTGGRRRLLPARHHQEKHRRTVHPDQCIQPYGREPGQDGQRQPRTDRQPVP